MNYDKKEIKDNQDYLVGLHQKPGLSSRIRYLASIEACIALGEDHFLRFILRIAIKDGVKLEEIYEVMLQASIFCGFPRTINAFSVLRRVLKEIGCEYDLPEPKLDTRSERDMEIKGFDLFCTIYENNHFEVINSLKAGHPELPTWILKDVYGKVLSRPYLDPKTRELAAVAGLTVSKVFPQLLSHIKGGLNLGADMREVKEVIVQMEAFASEDTVRRALRILKLGTRARKEPPQQPVNEAS